MANKMVTEGTIKVNAGMKWDEDTNTRIPNILTLTVGEAGASSCINGDAYPGTIVSATVNPEGFAVSIRVQSDDYKVKEGCGGFYEGPKPCDFFRNPNGGIATFRRDKRGSWRQVGCRYHGLCFERMYAYNPHV